MPASGWMLPTRWAPGLVALVSVTTIGLGQEPTQSSAFPGEPTAGRRLFLERGCVRCHSIWGNGGTLGPDFAIIGAGRSMQQLAGMFWNHTPRMIETVRNRGVEWPTFTEAELSDVISYVYYVKLFDEPGDPALGERWFREKRCGECHAVGGTGGRIGPALDRYASYIAPIMLAQGMWNHGPAMQATQSARGVAIPTFVGREMADIQAFIRRRSALRDREVVFLRPPDPGNGQRLFDTKGCRRCHGPEGRGSGNGPDLRTATLRLRVSEIAGVLWNHSFQMSVSMRARGFAFPQFEGTEMADVIAFLYYLRFNETGGDVQAGAGVFEQKGCVRCHARDGQPAIGPDLSASAVTRTRLGLAVAMWNHAPAMYDRVQVEKIEWPRFESDEMRDLAEYLKRLGTRAATPALGAATPALGAAAPAPRAAAPAAPAAKRTQGKPLYESKCAPCHGPAGVPPAPILQVMPAIATFNRAFLSSHSEDSVVKVLERGGKTMKSFKDELSHGQMVAVARYVRELASKGN